MSEQEESKTGSVGPSNKQGAIIELQIEELDQPTVKEKLSSKRFTFGVEDLSSVSNTPEPHAVGNEGELMEAGRKIEGGGHLLETQALEVQGQFTEPLRGGRKSLGSVYSSPEGNSNVTGQRLSYGSKIPEQIRHSRTNIFKNRLSIKQKSIATSQKNLRFSQITKRKESQKDDDSCFELQKSLTTLDLLSVSGPNAKSGAIQLSTQAHKLAEKRRNSIHLKDEVCQRVRQSVNSGTDSMSGRTLHEALQLQQKEVAELKSQIHMRNIFQNMLIHDMRNPTNSIQVGLEQILKFSKCLGASSPQAEELMEAAMKICELLRGSCRDAESDEFIRKFEEYLNQYIRPNVNSPQSILPSFSEYFDFTKGSQAHLGACSPRTIVEAVQARRKAEPNYSSQDGDALEERKELEQDLFRIRKSFMVNWDEENFDFSDNEIDEFDDKNVGATRNLSPSNILSKANNTFRTMGFDASGGVLSMKKDKEPAGECSSADQVGSRCLFQPSSRPFVLSSETGVQCDIGDVYDFSEMVNTIKQLSAENERLRAENQKLNQNFEKLAYDAGTLITEFKQLSLVKESQLKLASAAVQAQHQALSLSLAATQRTQGKIESMLVKQVFSQQMMGNLINELMDLAKLENSSFKFDEHYFNLIHTIYESTQMVLYQAQSRGVNLRVEIDDLENLGFVERVYGDSRRYLQILLNFLSNALKFTSEGGDIIIKIKMKSKQNMSFKPIDSSAFKDFIQNGEDSDQKFKELFGSFADNPEGSKAIEGNKYQIWLRIDVQDSGSGISSDGLSKLFLDFGKLDENSSQNRQGTGLGLSICKKIIEQMGGSVEVSSIVDRGTTFFINVKTECIYKEPTINENELITQTFGSPKKNPNSHVIIMKQPRAEVLETRLEQDIGLLLSKNAFRTQDLSSTMTTTQRKETETMKSLTESLAKIHRQLADKATLALDRNTVENLIGDLNLQEPCEDGCLSPNQKEPEEAGLCHSPFSEYGDSSPVRPRLRPTATFNIQGSEQFSVLIANDDPMQLHVQQLLFEHLDFKVETAINGQMAFKKVKDSIIKGMETSVTNQEIISAYQYDLILLDLHMPITNGYEACEQILGLFKDFKLFKRKKKGEEEAAQLPLSFKSKEKKNDLPSLCLPLICANTAFLDESVVEKCKRSGFDLYFSCIKSAQIQEELVPLLEERQKDIERENDLKINVLTNFQGERQPQPFDSAFPIQQKSSIREQFFEESDKTDEESDLEEDSDLSEEMKDEVDAPLGKYAYQIAILKAKGERRLEMALNPVDEEVSQVGEQSNCSLSSFGTGGSVGNP